MTKRIKLAFDARGISIPFPQRDVHMYHHVAEAAAEGPARVQLGLQDIAAARIPLENGRHRPAADPE